MSDNVLVIGGGVAGLMAALHLAERGLCPIVLEADPDRVGGRLKDSPTVAFEHAGACWSFPGEHGVHGIWSPYRNLLGVLNRHALLPDLIPAREETWILGRSSKIRRARIGSAIRSSPIPAPFHYLFCLTRLRFLNILTIRDLAALFRVVGGLFGAMAIDPLAEHKALSGMSLADFTAGWSPTLQSLFAGLARNALAARAEEVPAAGFIAFLRFYTLLRRDAWRFSYLPGTGGTLICEPLAALLRRLGATILLGSKVTQIERVGQQWCVTCATEAGDAPARFEASQLILAVDAPAAQTLLSTSPTTARSCAELFFPRGVPTAIIRLWFERRSRMSSEAGMCSGDFVIDNFFWLDQLHPAYREWSRATGGSAVEMHIYGPQELLEQPDAALLARVVQDTYRAFPEVGPLLHYVLQRNDATHTLFGVGDPGRHLGIETPWPGLWMCGDWVYHPTPALYLERATVTGIAAANQVLSVYGQASWPLLDHPAPEWLAGKLAAAFWRVRQHLLRRKRARLPKEG